MDHGWHPQLNVAGGYNSECKVCFAAGPGLFCSRACTPPRTPIITDVVSTVASSLEVAQYLSGNAGYSASSGCKSSNQIKCSSGKELHTNLIIAGKFSTLHLSRALFF